jgi:hypothetical protein
LLRNLKRARDLNLLLQPGFFEDACLLRFFGGTGVTWHPPVGSPGNGFQDATVVFGKTPFPGMVVSLRKGELHEVAHMGPKGELIPAYTKKSGVLTMKFDPLPGLTVEAVRHDFGPAPIETGPELMQSPHHVGAREAALAESTTAAPPESDIPVIDVYLKYASQLDLATRMASHVEKSEATFGIDVNEMIVSASLFESEM